MESIGHTIESSGPVASVGECCEIEDSSVAKHRAEVIGFRGTRVISMPMKTTDGVRYGDTVTALGRGSEVVVGEGAIGQILDGSGIPLDGRKVGGPTESLPLEGSLHTPLDRVPIQTPLGTGIRTLDALLTVGRGQRIGIFGGSGVGKSTLIGIMTRNTEADITVVGLVGERGREVREFVEDALGPEGLARSVVVVSTSDQSPLMRMCAALTATAIAEYFAGQGKAVLLVLDSLTRFAMAAREIGLAAGEPPTAKGYTPSVFARLAKLVERAGNFNCCLLLGSDIFRDKEIYVLELRVGLDLVESGVNRGNLHRIRHRHHQGLCWQDGLGIDLQLTRGALTMRGYDRQAAPISLSVAGKSYEFAGGSTRVFNLRGDETEPTSLVE